MVKRKFSLSSFSMMAIMMMAMIIVTVTSDAASVVSSTNITNAAAAADNRTGRVAAAAAAAAASTTNNGPQDLITGLIDHLTCTRTTNRGHQGKCIPRSCCATNFAVDSLCIGSGYTCCYGGNECTGLLEGDRFHDYPPIDGQRQPLFEVPNRDVDGASSSSARCRNRYVRRYEWNAAPTRERVRRLPRRVEHIIIHHTGDGDRQCWSYEECKHYLQMTQDYYQNRKRFPDLPWHFLIGENGEVFEGMGWGYEGYHTDGWNDRSLGVAFIGDFDRMAPTRRAMMALEQLLDCGVEDGYINSYFGLYGHRDMRDTDCPGDLLYDAIRNLRAFQRLGVMADRKRRVRQQQDEVALANAVIDANPSTLNIDIRDHIDDDDDQDHDHDTSGSHKIVVNDGFISSKL